MAIIPLDLGKKEVKRWKNPTTIQEIVQRLENLSPGQQQEVLDFTMELSGELPEGTSIKEFIKFAGTIPLKDLEEMKQAINMN